MNTQFQVVVESINETKLSSITYFKWPSIKTCSTGPRSFRACRLRLRQMVRDLKCVAASLNSMVIYSSKQTSVKMFSDTFDSSNMLVYSKEGMSMNKASTIFAKTMLPKESKGDRRVGWDAGSLFSIERAPQAFLLHRSSVARHPRLSLLLLCAD